MMGDLLDTKAGRLQEARVAGLYLFVNDVGHVEVYAPADGTELDAVQVRHLIHALSCHLVPYGISVDG